MRERYRIYLRRRSGMYYCQDNETGRQTSLGTSDEKEARRLVQARNEAATAPLLNAALGRAYLGASDPTITSRTWSAVMDEFQAKGKSSTRARYDRAMKDAALAPLRSKPLVETKSDDFIVAMRRGHRSTAFFLRRLHNLALDLGWLPWQVLPPKSWPAARWKARRAITPEEHRRIVETEMNLERRSFYQALWELGAAQSDVAALTAEQVDWARRVVVFKRMKTGEVAQVRIGHRLEQLLKELPAKGPLFPKWGAQPVSARAAEFRRRCRVLKLDGISMHSYRYSWAERAYANGYPERFAQAALGHASRAVHHSYARSATVLCPPLEDYEDRGAAVPGVTVPGVTVPGVTVPGVTVPGVTVPGVTVPGVTVPGVTVEAAWSAQANAPV